MEGAKSIPVVDIVDDGDLKNRDFIRTTQNKRRIKVHTKGYKCLLASTLACAGMWLSANAQGLEAALEGAVSIKAQEGVVNVPVQNIEQQVKWMSTPIKIDGDKSDWVKSGVKPVHLGGDKHATWFKGKYGGDADFAADVWLGRDFDNLYIGVEVKDDKLPLTDRIEMSFVDYKTEVIVGWQDVGRRYKADDLHTIFVIGKDDAVGIHMPHLQTRMDWSEVQDSYGSESERRAILEQKGPTSAASHKIYTKVTRKIEKDGKSVTFAEFAMPWKSLLPFDPVRDNKLKMNIAVHDKDGGGLEQVNGVVAWTPGLIGVFSGAHSPTLVFEPPQGRKGVDAFAQVGAFHYLQRPISAEVSLLNSGAATKGKLQLLEAPGKGKPFTEIDVNVPAGYSSTNIVVDSESVGKARVELMCRLMLEGGAKIEFPVYAPRGSNEVSIQFVAEIKERVAELERNYAALTNLYDRVEKAGLDTVYPKAYVTLLEMFIPLSHSNLQGGYSDRIIMNTDHLRLVYKKAADYMNEILKDESKQLKVPPKFKPEKLVIKDGYWYDGNRPVFLFGPCVFWEWRDQQQRVIDLGNNSVCPEVPFRFGATNAESVARMKIFQDSGVHVNVAMEVPDLNLTGSDVRASKLLNEHPELKNMDPNNFLSFVIQHPMARQRIEEGFKKSIEFWKHFPGINSYWLWNEPWYTNYGEMTRLDFIEAMKKKYNNDISAVNKRWKTDYKSFPDIKLITWPQPDNTAQWYDFQMFRDDILVDFFSYLNTLSKKYNPNMPTHTKFMAPSLHSFSIERLQEIYDIAGHDGNSGDHHIIFYDFCRSLYPEKPLSNTEGHIWYGGKKFVEGHPWRLALHGLANENWWCWHANWGFSDSISNAQSMDALTFAGLDLQRLMYPYVHAVVVKPQEIATLFPDVVERRSDIKIQRIRFEMAVPQYWLGLRPFYATETRIAKGELGKQKFLIATESDYVKDSTYEKVLEFVKNGGTVVVMKGSFKRNEYGDPRDASELVKAEGGEAYGEYARIYPVGEGKAICIDKIEMLPDYVTDGSQSMGGAPNADQRRPVYYSVIDKLATENNLYGEVRLVATDEVKKDPNSLNGYDWRAAKLDDGAYSLMVMAGNPEAVKLETSRPIKRIVNMVTEKEVPEKDFKLEDGRNLFRIELK